ncbi:MAG: type II secretion system F family protein [Gammaproteobacteria bacterium]|nr:type II secretion system F family protein [Gammaproteobacteria bacterium]
MPEYDYEIVDSNGQASQGRLEAASQAEAVRQLSSDGRTVVAVDEHRAPALGGWRRGLKAQDVAVAFNELATLLESGVALGEAVTAQARGTHHPRLSAAFDGMARDLMRGQSYLEVLRESALPLPEYVFQLVEAGELRGRLAEALRGAVQQMEYDLKVASDIRGALAYPAVLIVAGVAAVIVVFTFVVPQFTNLLESGSDLPLLASAVLGAGAWFNANAWLLAGTIVAVAAVVAALIRREAVRRGLTDAVARLPLVRGWFSEVDTAKWASVMGAMLASRVELMDALGLASRGVRISRRKEMLDRAADDVRSGVALSAALEKQDALTPTGYNLIRVGEQSGRLAEMMRALAKLYEENSARRMRRLLTFIEPAAVLLIGGFLGTIMIGMILAITSVNRIVL